MLAEQFRVVVVVVVVDDGDGGADDCESSAFLC